MSSETTNKMGVRPVGPLMLTMALPIMGSMMVQALYNIVDSIFIARLSEQALTAVSLAFPVQMLMISVGVGSSVGVNSLLSRRLGERRKSDAEQVAGNGLFLSLVISAVFALLGLFFAKPFMSLFTKDPEIAPLGVTYVTICTVASLGIFGQLVMERIMQSTGDTVRPMITQLVGALINIILDPILIFGLFGFPRMEVAGAAVATVIGQWSAMILAFILLRREKTHIDVTLRMLRPRKRIIVDIYRVGLPSIIMQSIGSVMTVGMNKILIAFSATAVSVFGIYFKLQSFVFMPIFGITMAAVPIIGFNFGARNPQRIAQAVKTAIIMAIIIMSGGLILFQSFPRFLLSLFDASPEMYAIGMKALRIISLHFPLAGVAIVFSTFFQAIGRGTLSLILSVVRQLVFLLPSAFILATFVGLDAVWYAFLISEVVSAVMSSIMFRHTYRERIEGLVPLELS